MYLCTAAPKPAEFVNRTTAAGETALDLVVNQRRNTGRAGFGRTARYLLQAGGRTQFTEEANKLAATANQQEPDVPAEVAIVLQAEKREAEILQRRQRERMSDPHYQVLVQPTRVLAWGCRHANASSPLAQLLFVDDIEKARRAEEAKRRAAEEAERKRLESAQLLVDRNGMLAADNYSVAREHIDRKRVTHV